MATAGIARSAAEIFPTRAASDITDGFTHVRAAKPTLTTVTHRIGIIGNAAADVHRKRLVGVVGKSARVAAATGLHINADNNRRKSG
jgi:hypothetical protein